MVGPSDPSTLLPDLSWLRAEFERRNTGGAAGGEGPGQPPPGQRPIRMVTVVNPGNPSGVAVPGPLLRELAALCRAHGCWCVVDNTYEHFAGGWCVLTPAGRRIAT